MILGYLLKTSRTWHQADVRLKMVVPTEAAAEDARRNLTKMLEQTRTGLKPTVLVGHDRPALDVLHDSSKGADLILMGIAAPDQGDFAAYFEQLREVADHHMPCAPSSTAFSWLTAGPPAGRVLL